MTNIIFLSIKLAPRLLFQAYVQPSKAYDFLNQDKKNQIIFVLASFWGGLLWGAALSIPHYFLYRSLIHSIIFAFAAAFALAMAAAAAAAVAGSVPGAVFFVFVAAFVSGGLLAAAGGGAASGAVAAVAAGAISISGMFGIIILLATIFGIYLLSPWIVVAIFILIALVWLIHLLISRKKSNQKADLKNPTRWYILFLFVLMTAVTGRGLLQINTYETVIFPFSFVMGYLFSAAFKFTRENKKLKENLAADNIGQDDVARRNYSKRQKASLIWGPLLALFLYLPVYFNWAAKLQNKLPVIALGFAVMPIFILRLPDYLLCLPVWLYQRRKILKKEKGSEEMLSAYQKSVLFKHEMLVLPLPGQPIRGMGSRPPNHVVRD